jgi:hypothetical protein
MSAKAFTDARPILLLGDTGRDQLLRKLQSAVDSWGEVWSVHRFDVALENAADTVQRRSTVWVAELQGRALLTIQAPGDIVPTLMGRHAVTPAGLVSGAVADELETKIVRSLCEHLVRVAGIEDIPVRRMEVAVAEESHAHHVQITVRDTRTRMSLALDAGLVERVIKRQSLERAAETIVVRRSAIGSATLGLQAVLGIAEVSLAELSQLREGDVIVLSNKLTEPVQLLNDVGHLIARAKVGTSGADRAVSVVAAHDRK